MRREPVTGNDDLFVAGVTSLQVIALTLTIERKPRFRLEAAAREGQKFAGIAGICGMVEKHAVHA